MKNIKKLCYNDLTSLKEFLFKESDNFKNFLEIGWNSKNIESHFKKNNNLSLGYFYKDILCGILIGEKISNQTNFELEIHIMYVSKKYRRIQFGTRLLNYIEKNRNLLNISKIYLEVSEDNPEGLRFYEKNNFVFFKIRHNYYNNKNHLLNALCYFKNL